jgi:hypothetical protein
MQNPNNRWNKNIWMLCLLGRDPSFKVIKNLIQTTNIWMHTKREREKIVDAIFLVQNEKIVECLKLLIISP